MHRVAPQQMKEDWSCLNAMSQSKSQPHEKPWPHTTLVAIVRNETHQKPPGPHARWPRPFLGIARAILQVSKVNVAEAESKRKVKQPQSKAFSIRVETLFLSLRPLKLPGFLFVCSVTTHPVNHNAWS